MGTPIFKLVFDRKKRASATKEGSVDLRITYDRIQRHVATGVRCLPKQWRNGSVVNRMDAIDMQQTLDTFVAKARRIVNEQMQAGTFDILTICPLISGKQKKEAGEKVPAKPPLMQFLNERATIRKYGLTKDSQERYDRFLRWFEQWGGMQTFGDITEINVLKMDEALVEKKLKQNSKWNNYHRFFNSFILDAIDEGLMNKNPYKRVHIDKEQETDPLERCLTKEEVDRIAQLDPTTDYLRHAQDLFIFQSFTGLSYIDLSAFDANKLRIINGQYVYSGKRGKTNAKFTFMLMQPALNVLKKYGWKLPIMSNQKYNDRLKILAVMAGINKPISCHWARHTCATLLVNNGVTEEIVSKVLGHKSTKITRQVYAKLLDETVADAMSRVEARLQ
jgi:site-specific recombinase XerD